MKYPFLYTAQSSFIVAISPFMPNSPDIASIFSSLKKSISKGTYFNPSYLGLAILMVFWKNYNACIMFVNYPMCLIGTEDIYLAILNIQHIYGLLLSYHKNRK